MAGEERTSPSGKVVHAAIREEGTSELERSSWALGWSGLAAGLSMGFSFLGVGLLRAFLPDSDWAPLVTSFGYTLGFLIVILGRQQLFTENTLTVVLPLMLRRDGKTARNVVRLWVVVLASNVVGALLFALVLALTRVVDATIYEAVRNAAHDSIAPSRIWVIVILTCIVGLARLTHVIVGTVDASFLVFAGDSSWTDFLRLTFVPALLGNIIGGVALVAALNHAQVVAGEEGIDA